MPLVGFYPCPAGAAIRPGARTRISWNPFPAFARASCHLRGSGEPGRTLDCPPMASKTPPPDLPAPTFDQRLQRLEAIVVELEQGGLALEPSIERYQEGVGLLRDCRAVLQGLEKRVEELSAQGGLEPLAGDPDAGPPGAGRAGGGRG